MAASSSSSSSQASDFCALFQENLERYTKKIECTVLDGRPESPRNSLDLRNEEQQRESDLQESQREVSSRGAAWEELLEEVQGHGEVEFMLRTVSTPKQDYREVRPEYARRLFPTAPGKVKPTFLPSMCREGEGATLLQILRYFPSAEDLFSLFYQRCVPTDWLHWLLEEEMSRPTAWQYLVRHMDVSFSEEHVLRNPVFKVTRFMLPDRDTTNQDIRDLYTAEEWERIEAEYGAYERDVASFAFRKKMEQVGYYFHTLLDMDMTIHPLETWFALRRKLVVPDLIDLFFDGIIEQQVDVEKDECTLLLFATEDGSTDLMTLLLEDLKANPLVHFSDNPERCPVLRVCQHIAVALDQCDRCGQEMGNPTTMTAKEAEEAYQQCEKNMYKRVQHLMLLMGPALDLEHCTELIRYRGDFRGWLEEDQKMSEADVGFWSEVLLTMEETIGDPTFFNAMLYSICLDSCPQRIQYMTKQQQKLQRDLEKLSLEREMI